MQTKKHKFEHTESEEASKDEDINIDFSRVKKIFSNPKINNALLIIFLLLIPIILTIYIRIQPEQLPSTDVWAANTVNTYFRNAITQQVNSQYPNLPQQNKEALINQQFAEFVSKNKDQIDQQIKSTSEYFKTGFRYEENGTSYTFLGDLDSYAYLRAAKNLEATGMVCDVVINGKCIDNHMLAPLGIETGSSMHHFGIVYLYRILHFINPKVNLMQASFFLPTVLAVIAAIAAFFIGRRLMNNTAGFFAAVLVAVSPLFITRTLGSDTDIWNVMFPLIILWVFLEAIETKSILKKSILALLAGIFVGFFSFAWGGWWYVFDFLIVTIVMYILFELLRNYLNNRHLSKTISSEIKFTGLVFLIFFVVAFIMVSIMQSPSFFFSIFTTPLYMLSSFKIAAHTNLWPNVYTTVAELNPASIDTIINQVSYGIHLLFALALFGIVLTMVKRKPDVKEYILLICSGILYLFLVSTSAVLMSNKIYLILMSLPVMAALILVLTNKQKSEIDIKPALLLTVWFIAMIYSSTQGVRFILLLIPAFSIALGVAVGYVYQYLTRLFIDVLKISKYISKIGLFLILCLILITPINTGLVAGETFVPSITRGWWDSLTKIRLESKPDSIINSWWDFGHWFKYVADRRVTLDGATQNHPNAHWLGRILQTNNEKEAIAILRMLDCGSNTAFEVIDEKYQNTLVSVTIIKTIIMMDDEEKIKSYLTEKGFDNEQIMKVLNYTKCDPPDNYFITSEDMVGKAGVWAHFGLWDFKKSYIINSLKDEVPETAISEMQANLGYSPDQAKQLYYEVQTLTSEDSINAWISPWPNYLVGSAVGCSKDNESDIVECNLGIGLGSQNGRNIYIEKAFVDISDPTNTTLLMGFYDANLAQRVGETVLKPSGVIIGRNNKLTKYAMNESGIGYDLLLSDTDGTYSAVMSSPELLESMFTRLFYLDGKYTSHFEKFSDVTDITGQRIIVWKVKWD